MTVDNSRNLSEEITELIKKVYSSPLLQEYGNIRELVKSGNSAGVEGVGDDDPRQQVS